MKTEKSEKPQNGGLKSIFTQKSSEKVKKSHFGEFLVGVDFNFLGPIFGKPADHSSGRRFCGIKQ